MKYLLILLFPITVHAAPWNADCVTFWGKAIPVEERNSENCPTGRSHWDQINTSSSTQTRDSGTVNAVPGYQQSTQNNSLNPTTPAVIITNSGNYIVAPRYNGGSYPSAVIRSGK